MTPDHLRRIREYVRAVDATMNAVPLPTPPAAVEGWDGALMDIRPLHLAYNRLPAGFQTLAEAGYARCLDALELQRITAGHACTARYKVFADVVFGAGITPEELVPDARHDPHLTLVRDDAGDEPAAGERLDDLDEPNPPAGGPSARILAMPLPEQPPAAAAVEPEIAKQAPLRRLRAYSAAASAVALAAVAVLVWQQWATPPARAEAFSIDRVSQSDDMTVIVSHAERAGAMTRVHVYVTNTSDDTRTATLAIGDGDATTESVPPKATRHRVIEVPTALMEDSFRHRFGKEWQGGWK